MLSSLKSNIERIIGGVIIITLAGLLISKALDAHHWHKLSDNYEKLWKGEKLAHQQTEINYRRAADEARAKDAENLKRVQAEQSQINKETTDALEKRLADARNTAERLRREAANAPGNPGSTGKPPVPVVSTPTGGPAETTLEDQLLATEQAIQLDELIKWVRKLHGVEVSK